MSVRICRDCGCPALESTLACCVCGSNDIVGLTSAIVGEPALAAASAQAGARTIPAPLGASPGIAPAWPALEPAPAQHSEPAADPDTPVIPNYLSVTTGKFIVMSVFTFGICQLYWFFKQWRAIQRSREPRIRPFWRMFFSPLFAPGLFGRVHEDAHAVGFRTRWNPDALGMLYFVSCLAAWLPGLYSMLFLLGTIPLVPVQRTIRHMTAAPGHSPLQYSEWNMAGIAVGAVFWFIVIVGQLAGP